MNGHIVDASGAENWGLRMLVAVALGCAFGLFAFSFAAGVVVWPAALAVGALAGAASGRILWRRPAVTLDAAACSRGLKALSAVACVVALVQLGRLSVYMISAAQPGWSAVPSSDWEVRHSCLTAYHIAAQAGGSGNIYDNSLYSAPDDNPARPRKPLMLGPFRVDVYEYPPPFLTLPRALHLIAPDFMRLRPLWFGLSGAVILVAMLSVVRLMGAAQGTRALLLAPLVFAALATLSTLQKGNVQPVVIALAVLAMALFERRRWISGGALLAFSIISKLFPGMLAIVLLVQHKWRALVWTCVIGCVLTLITLLDLGPAPFAAFVQHLPGLLSGEAFPAFRNPGAVAINVSVPGIVFKLKLFGGADLSFGASKLIGWVYTVVVVWATVVLARRPLPEAQRPLAWVAVITLATLRSPFLPNTYAVFPAFWLLTLLAATAQPTGRTLLLTIAGFIGLCAYWPMDGGLNPRSLALLSAIPQAMMILLPALVLRRAMTASATLGPASAPVPAVS